MIDRVAHYRRVWDCLADEIADAVEGGKTKSAQVLLSSFVVHAVLDRRPLRNVVTQWEIDADSVIEQSLDELRGFHSCLSDYLREEAIPDKVRESFGALAIYFLDIANHAEARAGMRALWLEVIPQIRCEAHL